MPRGSLDLSEAHTQQWPLAGHPPLRPLWSGAAAQTPLSDLEQLRPFWGSMQQGLGLVAFVVGPCCQSGRLRG
jgi:hypothetical protein